MAATISESYLSRSFTLGRQAVRELIYDIQDATNEDEASAILISTAPATYKALMLDSVNADPIGNDIWKGYARYVRFANDNEYTFDTGGGSQKITQSLSTVASYAPAGQAAPDFRGSIGVSDDKVEGVDIVAPQYQFTETKIFTDASVTTAFKLILFNLTGRTNNATFKGFAAGEVLFMGATGSKRGDEDWSITFRFTCSPNATGLSIGATPETYYGGYGGSDGTITGIAKKGWEYLWVRYADFVDTFAFALVKQPVAVYVERVYYSGNYSTLGIGT